MNSINSNPVRLKNISFFIFFIFTINFLLILNVIPQVTEEWVARYNGPGNYNDNANAMALDSSGNVYVTGGSEGDYATIKYNSAGVEQWVARYNSGEEAYAIAIDNSGNVYVTGYSFGSGTYFDYATIKYNSEGVEQWIATYNGPGNSSDYAKAIALDSSGNVYITGYSRGLGTDYHYYDYATIKYNSSGVEQWVARYNGPTNSGEEATAITIDSSGNVYVTGNSEGDYATIKYNSLGVEQWVARYNGPGNDLDEAKAITLDSSGNVYVTGESYGSGTYDDYATIKYNSSGVQQWVARYNGPGNGSDYARAIVLDSLGNVYVTGGSSLSGTNYDYATIKYNSAGVEQWVARYNGPGNDIDWATAIVVDNSGNVYVTGYSAGSGPFPMFFDYATIKYNNAGVEEWVARYNGPGDDYDEATAVAVDSSGNAYVTGWSYGLGTYDDYATIKYSQEPLISEVWVLY